LEEEIIELTVNEEEILDLAAELGGLPSEEEDESATGLRVSEDFHDVTTELRNSEHVCRGPARVEKSLPATGDGSINQHVSTGPAEMSRQLVPRSEASAQAIL
jgi:hypothetical protein